MNENRNWKYEGTGLIWKKLVIDDTFGYLSNAQPEWILDKVIDLSNFSKIEDAIVALHEHDNNTHTELTMYADEG